MSWPLLGIPLSLHTVTALVAICAAVVIYAQVVFSSSHFYIALEDLINLFGAEPSGQPKQQQANRRGQGCGEGLECFEEEKDVAKDLDKV